MSYLMMLAIPAYAVLQGYALLRLPGRWRVAALLPLPLTLPLAAVSLDLLTRGSNLWPLPLLAASAVGAAFLAILVVARRLAAGSAASAPADASPAAPVTTERRP